jgi:outer membrane protein TolC
MKFFFVFLLFGLFANLFAQTTQTNKQDTVVVQPTDFFKQILQNHPIAKQANLLSDFGKQEVRLARGLFDPKFNSNLERKDFKDKMYYEIWETQLKMPLWIGEIKAGYDRTRGDLLNEQSTLPANGLEYVGISVPLGQGLLMDYRRATLREAQFTQKIMEAERIKAINKLLLQAAKDYWAWFEAYYQYKLAQKGYDLATIRYEGIVERAIQGDAAAIDSTEAQITVQDRQITLQKAQVTYINARYMVSNHLWDENNSPLEMTDLHIPTQEVQRQQGTTADELLKYATENHPELQKLNFKLSQLAVQRKMAVEMFKPVIDVTYSFLGIGSRLDGKLNNVFLNDFKWGFNVAFPLLFRKERAKFQQIKIKQSQTTLERLQLNREIGNEIKTLYNELQNTEKLLTQVAAMINNYGILVGGEIEKFRNGESSLFLVNSREGKLLEAEAKRIELQFKYAKTRATLLWAAGKGIED